MSLYDKCKICGGPKSTLPFVNNCDCKATIEGMKKELLNQFNGKQCEKPPKGIIPREIALDKFNVDRLQGLHEAMMRFVMVGKEFPKEWLDEYELILSTFNGR